MEFLKSSTVASNHLPTAGVTVFSPNFSFKSWQKQKTRSSSRVLSIPNYSNKFPISPIHDLPHCSSPFSRFKLCAQLRGPSNRQNYLRKKLTKHTQVSPPNSDDCQNSNANNPSEHVVLVGTEVQSKSKFPNSDSQNADNPSGHIVTGTEVESKSKLLGGYVFRDQLDDREQNRKDVEFWATETEPIFRVVHDSEGKVKGDHVLPRNSSVARYAADLGDFVVSMIQGVIPKPAKLSKLSMLGITVACCVLVILSVERLFSVKESKPEYTSSEKEMMRRKLKARLDKEKTMKVAVEVIQDCTVPVTASIERPQLDKQELMNSISEVGDLNNTPKGQLDNTPASSQNGSSQSSLLSRKDYLDGNQRPATEKDVANLDIQPSAAVQDRGRSNNSNDHLGEASDSSVTRKIRIIKSVKEAREYLAEQHDIVESNFEHEGRTEEQVLPFLTELDQNEKDVDTKGMSSPISDISTLTKIPDLICTPEISRRTEYPTISGHTETLEGGWKVKDDIGNTRLETESSLAKLPEETETETVKSQEERDDNNPFPHFETVEGGWEINYDLGTTSLSETESTLAKLSKETETDTVESQEKQDESKPFPLPETVEGGSEVKDGPGTTRHSETESSSAKLCKEMQTAIVKSQKEQNDSKPFPLSETMEGGREVKDDPGTTRLSEIESSLAKLPKEMETDTLKSQEKQDDSKPFPLSETVEGGWEVKDGIGTTRLSETESSPAELPKEMEIDPIKSQEKHDDSKPFPLSDSTEFADFPVTCVDSIFQGNQKTSSQENSSKNVKEPEGHVNLQLPGNSFGEESEGRYQKLASSVNKESWLEENFHEVEPIVKKIGDGFRGNYKMAKAKTSDNVTLRTDMSQLMPDEDGNELEWMKDEKLREIVFKVRENELAGRDPFHLMDDQDKLAFYSGLEKKVEQENAKLANLHEWLHSNIENLDYGADGISLYDPPEKIIPRWKGPPVGKISDYLNNSSTRQKELVPENVRKSNITKRNVEDGIQPSKDASSLCNQYTNPQNRALKGPRTVVEGSDGSVRAGKKKGKEYWQHTKKWSQGFLESYNVETDPEVKAVMRDMGKDLDRWITEKEIKEAADLMDKLPERGQELIIEKLNKFKREMEVFGPQAVVSKYREYADEKEEDYLWWLDLPYVLCIELYTQQEGEQKTGFYSLEMAADLELDPKQYHVIAFEDAGDCKNMCYIIQAHMEMLGSGNAFVVAQPPKDAFREAKANGFGVSVIRKGEVQLNVDQTLEEVEESIAEIGSKIYHDTVMRERSVDISGLMKGVFGLKKRVKRKRSRGKLKKPASSDSA